MGSPGRPRKQQPYRPGAPMPVPAAGCGPQRRLAAAKPKRLTTPLRLTLGNGYRQDDIATWRRRTKKGSDDTVIDARQYVAGRRIQDMTQTLMDDHGLRAFDTTLPVVDISHSPRWGGYGPEARAEDERFKRLGQHLGQRDLKFLVSVLGGMGIHGAMLNEAGLEWRCPPDRDIDQRTCTVNTKTGKLDLRTGQTDVSGASSILSVGGAYRIEPDFAEGGFAVEGAATPIYSKHKNPNDNGFDVDRRATAEKVAKDASLRVVSDKQQDATGNGEPADLTEIMEVAARALHSKRHPDEGVDPDVEAMREMHRKDPPPAHPDMDGDVVSIGGAIDASSYEHFHPWTTSDRAKSVFTTRQIELASARCRALLNDAANFFETDDAQRHDTTAVIQVAPAQISSPDDIPFDVGNVREYEEVEAYR
jgi:hypothetical protein